MTTYLLIVITYWFAVSLYVGIKYLINLFK